jgi:hypothetical protein
MLSHPYFEVNGYEFVLYVKLGLSPNIGGANSIGLTAKEGSDILPAERGKGSLHFLFFTILTSGDLTFYYGTKCKGSSFSAYPPSESQAQQGREWSSSRAKCIP